MFCSKCGKENSNSFKFCTNCGNKLNTNYQSPQNQGGIRKYLKNISQSKPKGPQIIVLVIMCAILTILFGIYGSFLPDSEVLYSQDTLDLPYVLSIIIPSVLISICTYILLLNLSLKEAQNQPIKFKDAFKFKNVKKIVPVLLIFFITFILYIGADYLLVKLTNDEDIIDIISLLLLIIYIYIYPIIDIFACASIDENNSDKNFITILKESIKLINHHHIEYYALYISFIGWFLLSPLTLFLLLFWLMPYINLSYANYYLYLKGDLKVEPMERGLNNATVIGLFIGIPICLLFIIGVIVGLVETTPQFDYSEENNRPTNYDEETTIIYDDNKQITFLIPSGFKLKDQTDGRGYYNKNNDYIYYYISDYSPEEYKTMKNEYLNSIKDAYDKVKYIDEYQVTINYQTVNVFKINITDDGYTYEETTAFYPITDEYAVEINIGIDGINQNNINKYIKIKDYSVSF